MKDLLGAEPSFHCHRLAKSTTENPAPLRITFALECDAIRALDLQGFLPRHLKLAPYHLNRDSSTCIEENNQDSTVTFAPPQTFVPEPTLHGNSDESTTRVTSTPPPATSNTVVPERGSVAAPYVVQKSAFSVPAALRFHSTNPKYQPKACSTNTESAAKALGTRKPAATAKTGLSRSSPNLAPARTAKTKDYRPPKLMDITIPPGRAFLPCNLSVPPPHINHSANQPFFPNPYKEVPPCPPGFKPFPYLTGNDSLTSSNLHPNPTWLAPQGATPPYPTYDLASSMPNPFAGSFSRPSPSFYRAASIF
ncbi:hypothetical protein Ciccas_009033 [Cichlidogyrus casuarinus]|uniref:Uncharacterized protein n=1 Tax=Cichlidogyrus casuarinus TaxID=1844966 RepID=A0ABD2PY77_9PLAT